MATIFSQLSQSGRSVYRNEVSNRRLRRAGLTPVSKPLECSKLAAEAIIADSIAVQPRKLSEMSQPELAALSDAAAHAAPNPAHLESALRPLPKRAGKKAPTKSADEAGLFIVEATDTPSGSKWRRVGKLRASRARDLASEASEHAKQHPGVKVRILRAGSDRATLRFCWQQDKLTGSWFLGSYR